MKIGIVTICSDNCGSFLQALALCEYTKNLGHDTAFARVKMSVRSRMWYRRLMSLKYSILGQKEKANKILKTTRGFREARKKYYRIRSVRDNDACIYGSDTIWNLDSEYFRRKWKHYWGKTFNGTKIAYAPSIGPAPIESVLNRDELCCCVKNFDHISVRDSKTLSLVHQILGDNSNIANVVDPTMLMPKSFYLDIAAECKESNFILFYYFGVPDKAYMEEIKRYAKEKGKKLICFGDNISGVDEQICFNPLDMMGYYSKADMIITNTFHGNVFSLIFNKPFVNIDAGKAKVDDLLKGFGLSERTVREAGNFSIVASQGIDFDAVNAVLEQKKAASGKYLNDALKDCERGGADAL